MKWIKLILFKVILPVFFTIIIIGLFYSLMTMFPFPKSLGNSPLIFLYISALLAVSGGLPLYAVSKIMDMPAKKKKIGYIALALIIGGVFLAANQTLEIRHAEEERAARQRAANFDKEIKKLKELIDKKDHTSADDQETARPTRQALDLITSPATNSALPERDTINTAPEPTYNYTPSYTPYSIEPREEFEEGIQNEFEEYVGNIKTGVFHRKSCQYVQRMRPRNKVFYYNRLGAILDGFTPCTVCRP